MDLTQEQIDQLKQKIPADIVDGIASFKFSFIVEEICGKYNLLISETNEVYQQVLKVIIGDLKPALFEETLKKNLPDQDKETIKNVIRDVDVEIFQKLKEHLVKAYEKKAPSDGTVGPEHRDQILAEIEDPHPAPVIKPLENTAPKTNIIEQKLQATVQTAPQTTSIVVETSKLPEKAPQTTPAIPPQTSPTVTSTAPKTYSSDPYRESI